MTTGDLRQQLEAAYDKAYQNWMADNTHDSWSQREWTVHEMQFLLAAARVATANQIAEAIEARKRDIWWEPDDLSEWINLRNEAYEQLAAFARLTAGKCPDDGVCHHGCTVQSSRLGRRQMADDNKTAETVRQEIAALLRKVADGRREYAGKPGDPYHDELIREAQTFEGAAKIAEEGEDACYGWLPSWRWTDEMERKLFKRE